MTEIFSSTRARGLTLFYAVKKGSSVRTLEPIAHVGVHACAVSNWILLSFSCQRRTRPEQISISAMLQIRCQESCLVIVRGARWKSQNTLSPPARSRECSPSQSNNRRRVLARMFNQQECPKGVCKKKRVMTSDAKNNSKHLINFIPQISTPQKCVGAYITAGYFCKRVMTSVWDFVAWKERRVCVFIFHGVILIPRWRFINSITLRFRLNCRAK
jgi:hypothetical protein